MRKKFYAGRAPIVENSNSAQGEQDARSTFTISTANSPARVLADAHEHRCLCSLPYWKRKFKSLMRKLSKSSEI